MTATTIFFDMDGTIADLYGVKNWLNYLISADVFPYKNAKPLVKLNVLARILNRLQKNGYKLGIISWLAKSNNKEYNERIKQTKIDWLNKHLKSVKFDEINIVEYGTVKSNFAKTENDILFDDEKPNREEWIGKAYNVDAIIEILKNL